MARMSLLLLAVALIFGPWVWAFSKSVGTTPVGSKEDGPYTSATYLSVVTLPVGGVLGVLALAGRWKKPQSKPDASATDPF